MAHKISFQHQNRNKIQQSQNIKLHPLMDDYYKLISTIIHDKYSKVIFLITEYQLNKNHALT